MANISSNSNDGGFNGNDEDNKTFLNRITGLLDKLNPKKKDKTYSKDSSKSRKGSHHSKEKSHRREHHQLLESVPGSVTIKVKHNADVPPQGLDADKTVFEGIRGRMKPAQSKFKKKKFYIPNENSVKTKSEIIPLKHKKKVDDGTQSAILSPTPSKKKKNVKKNKLPSDLDKLNSGKNVIDLLGKSAESNSGIASHVFKTDELAGTPNQAGFSVTKDLSSKRAVQTFPKHTTSDHWMEFETGSDFPDKSTLVPASKSKLDDKPQDQYVVYRYVNTLPVMGRAWNEGGKIVASFPFKGRELRTVGAEVMFLQRPNSNATFIYEWRPFKEVSTYESNKKWQPVRISNCSPGIIVANGGMILGQVDMRLETAAYAVNGGGYEISGPDVHKSIILCRKDL